MVPGTHGRQRKFRPIRFYLKSDASTGTCLRTSAPGRRRLRSLNLPEQLIEHPDQVVVVCASEHFRDKCASFDEELHGQFQAHEHEFGLAVRILNPSRSDIRSTVVENDVGLPVFYFGTDEISALRGSDIRSECRNSRDGLDWNKIDT